jgi:hypothetical protein
MLGASRRVCLAAAVAAGITPWSASFGDIKAPSASVTMLQLQVIHITRPEPPSAVRSLIVHERVRIAADVSVTGKVIRAPLRLAWRVTRGAQRVFGRLQRLSLTTDGRTRRRFTVGYAPCQSGRYQVTLDPYLKGVRGRGVTTQFQVLDKPGTAGSTLYAPGAGAVTLISATRTRALQYAPGTPEVDAAPGHEFLATRWVITNPERKVIAVIVPMLSVSGQKGRFLGGVPYSSNLSPGQSESVSFAFVVDARMRAATIVYPNGGAACRGNLMWKI